MRALREKMRIVRVFSPAARFFSRVARFFSRVARFFSRVTRFFSRVTRIFSRVMRFFSRGGRETGQPAHSLQSAVRREVSGTSRSRGSAAGPMMRVDTTLRLRAVDLKDARERLTVGRAFGGGGAMSRSVCAGYAGARLGAAPAA